MQLFNTRSFALVAGVAAGAFAFYGLGLSVVQGLPLTPLFWLTTISRCEGKKKREGVVGSVILVMHDRSR